MPKLDHVVEHARRLSTSTTLDNAMNYICSSTCQLGLRKSCYLVCVKKHTPSACYNFFSRRSRGKFPFELCANVPMEEGTRARRASLAAPVTIATRSSVQAAWCRNTNMVRTNVYNTQVTRGVYTHNIVTCAHVCDRHRWLPGAPAWGGARGASVASRSRCRDTCGAAVRVHAAAH